MKKCPHCAEEIQDEAKVCKHCGRDIPVAAATKREAPSGEFTGRDLMKDERMVYQTRLHWIVFVGPVVLFIIGSWLSSIPEIASIGAFLQVGAVLLGIVRVVTFTSSEFAVTSRRVIAKVGFIRRTSLETMLAKIEAVSVDQPILGRVFGYGTITVRGTGGSRETFPQIARPLDLRRHIQEQLP